MPEKKQVDLNLLKQAIDIVEKNGPLKNRSILYQQICDYYNKNVIGPKITISIVLLRIQNLGLIVKTPKGERGSGLKELHNLPKEKREIHIDSSYVIKLKKIYPSKYHKKCEKAERSRTAAIALKCLDCTAMQIKEIALCEIKECPLWIFRPYKAKENGEIVEIIDAENETSEMPMSN